MHNDASNPSDAEIIHQVITGNTNAFELILKRYEALVLKIVKKHVPYNEMEEIAQETFVRAYQALPSYKGTGEFKKWISSIAIRTCYDFWRKAYRSKEVPMSTLTDDHKKWLEKVVSDHSIQSLYEMNSRKEALEFLDYALARLSPQDRMVLELIYLEGLTGKEAADLLGWSVANVKVRAFRSRKKLYRLLNKLMEK